MSTDLTRDAAQRILDELPVDPPRVVQQRRLALLGEAHPTKDEEVGRRKYHGSGRQLPVARGED